MSENERIRILEMIERGELSADEGIQRMAALGGRAAPAEPESAMSLLEKIERGELSPEAAIAQMGGGGAAAGERIEVLHGQSASRTPISDEELKRWRRWWQIPLYLGLAVVLFSAYWAYSAYEAAAGVSFWFFCAWVPLLAGLVLLLLAWGSRTGTWVHVRVNEPPKDGKSGSRVAVSIPLPIGFTMWALRNFGHYIPELPHTSVDELLQALGNSAKAGEPLYINVDDEDGSHVEVYIG